MKTQLRGIIKEILPIEKKQIESGTFPSQQFIISEVDGKYQNEIIFNCWADKCNLLKNLKAGDNVLVEFFIRSTQSKGRYYTNLQMVNITQIETFVKINRDDF